jgi:hypothetical protein
MLVSNFPNIKPNCDAALVEWRLLLKAVFSVTLVNLMLATISLTAPFDVLKAILIISCFHVADMRKSTFLLLK